MPEADFERASLDECDLELLEEKLDMIQASHQPGRLRGGPESTALPYGEQEARDLDEVKSDILETARKGVNVAPFIESRPLAALFEAAGHSLPPEVKVDIERMRYDLYLAEASFSIKLDAGVGLRAAQFDIELSDDLGDPMRGVRPLRVFPGRKDIDLFKADVGGSVGIDANVQLTVPRAAESIIRFADLRADARLTAGIILGPFEFAFRQAAIEVTGENDHHVSWSYRLSRELDGKNDFKSILVLKVAREATKVDATASLTAVPYKSSWWPFQSALPRLFRRRRIPVELQGKVTP